MKKTFFSDKDFLMTARLPKHDLFFGAPEMTPSSGIPMGDGDTGSLLWLSERELHVVINKTDLWDDSTWDSDVYCSGQEENITCLRHGADISVRFASPCLDPLYQKNFEERLSLADATAKLDAETPFSHLQAKLFCSHAARVSVLTLSYAAAQPEPVEISLSRWGSRNLWRWYSQIMPAPEKGLDGTASAVEGNRTYITQELNGTHFCVGLHAVINGSFSAECPTVHEAKLTAAAVGEHQITVYYNVSLGATCEEAKDACDAALNAAIGSGEDALYAGHRDAWAEFWNRSYAAIEDDYQENLWALTRYYANCQCRGAYPPHFTCGVWGFQHDFVAWTYYFHYNMQLMYGPLQATGDSDLCAGYYNMRGSHLETSRRIAAKMNRKGAFYHDVADRYGRCAEYDSDNYTPGSQIAMAMWRHYRYTGDETFLREKALPVMTACADFYLSVLQKGDDGLYHIHGTTAYEGNPPTDDTLTDRIMIRALFGTLVGLDVPGKEKYLDVLRHLPEETYLTLDADEMKDGKMTFGIGAGEPAVGNGTILAIGFDEKGDPVRKSYGDPSKATYGFPDIEMAFLYPASVAGLADKGTQLFDALTNHANLHGAPGSCMHWCLMPIYLARLGMAGKLKKYVRDYADLWVIYPNGMNADSPGGIREAYDLTLAYRPELRGEKAAPGDRGYMPGYPFRHFDMEALPILATSMNESLLQSYDGNVRVFPAVEAGDRTAFRLYAEGGHRVSAVSDGRDVTVEVKSSRGEDFSLILPEWTSVDTLKYSLPAGATLEKTQIGAFRVTGLRPGDAVTFYTGEGADVPEVSCTPNRQMKTCGKSRLGIDPLDRVVSQ